MKRLKTYIKSVPLLVLRIVFAAQFRKNEKYHESIYRGYDGRFLNLLLKLFVNPTYLIRYFRYYLRFNPVKKTPKFSDSKWQTALDDLRRDGFTKIEFSEQLADYINQEYFRYLENDFRAKAFLREIDLGEGRKVYSRYANSKVDKTELNINSGIQINKLISFSDKKVADLLFNEDLHQLLCGYYKQQAFVRNHPAILKSDWRRGSPRPTNGDFHFDHFHQISLMFLVNDLGMQDTHMEYAKGSHKYVRTAVGANGHYFSRGYVYDHYEIAHAIGKRGTLFVFDTAGLHAGCYQESDNPRKMLHLNITPGHDIETNRFNSWSELPELRQKSQCVQRSFEKILLS